MYWLHDYLLLIEFFFYQNIVPRVIDVGVKSKNYRCVLVCNCLFAFFVKLRDNQSVSGVYGSPHGPDVSSYDVGWNGVLFMITLHS